MPHGRRFVSIKFGGGITEMRGSAGGNTYSRNRFGAYMRNRTVPTNPNTARQQDVKTAMAFLTDRWANTLTADQRTAWNLYGSSVAMLNRLGETIYLTGFNHYIRSNIDRKRIIGSTIDAGPTLFEIPAADPTFSITGTEAAQTIDFVYDDGMDWADENGAWLLLYQGKPQNPQRNFFGGPWRYCTIVEGVNGAPPAGPKTGAVTFAIAEGQHQWAYARILRADGRLSQPFRADAFCAA